MAMVFLRVTRPPHHYMGLPLSVPSISRLFSTFIPFFTSPNTTWWPSSHCVFTYPLLPFIMATVVMKNCEPLVSGPALAMDSMPGPVCFSLKFSSGKRSP